MGWQDGREPPERRECPECDGEGIIRWHDEAGWNEETCLRCDGTGEYVEDEKESD